MTKKTNGNLKTANKERVWYRKLIEGKTKAEFYRHFMKKVNTIITQHFGESETLRVLKGLETKRIKVTGIESFLFDLNDISDPSLELYNTCSSTEEFLTKSIAFFKRRAEMGETGIVVSRFFLVLSDLLAKDHNLSNFYIEKAIYALMASFITTTDKSPYIISIIEPKWGKEICSHLGLNFTKYGDVLRAIFTTNETLMASIKNCRAFLPPIKVIYPIYEDNRDYQLRYLISLFKTTDNPGMVRAALKDIPNLGEDTPQLRSSLEYLCTKSGVPINLEATLLELKRLEETSNLKRYPIRNTLTKIFKSYGSIPLNVYKKNSIEPIFVHKETFEKSLSPYFCEVEVDCSNLEKEEVEPFIDIAKTLNLVKGYYAKTTRDLDTLNFKIKLINVNNISKDFVNFVQEKIRKIESLTNKNFLVEICYNEKVITDQFPEEIVTHIRVISDIHADYNEKHKYNFNFGDDFIINCGDTAADAFTAAEWLNTYVHNGVTVIGNHFGYSSAKPELDGIFNMEKYGNTKHPDNSKNSQMRFLFNALDTTHISLLSNTCVEKHGIIILGTCLYTDFNLYGEDHREECMSYAKKYMNDFKLPTLSGIKEYSQTSEGEWVSKKVKASESKVRVFSPIDHAFYFHYSFNFLREKVAENPNKPIVIVTHHAPSPYSIAEKYQGDLLNAAFASNLNNFIIANPQIRLWCHGHMHDPSDYILGETRVVCCPFGYNNENEARLPYDYGLRIPISDIKSKKSWRKLLSKQIVLGKILVYDE